MNAASLRRQLGRVSGLVLFAAGMAVLVVVIAFGANVWFNRSFGPSIGGGATVNDGAASAAQAASASRQAGAGSGG